MAKSWYEIRNSANGETEISIMDEIGGWGISAKAFRDELSRIGDTENIHLRIHCPGGSITEGNEIYNALKERKGGVRVTIGALCASMATVIAMAGAPIAMAKNGFFMVHNPFVLAYGDSEEMRKMADIMDKMKGTIVSAYKAKTGLSEKELSAMMDEETWLTADEAKEKGFIDSVIEIEIEEEDDEPENFDLSKFKNAANFLSKLQSGRNTPPSVKATGNGAPVVTLRDLEAAKTSNVTPKPIKNMSEPVIDPAKVKAEADKMFKARMTRDKEIRDIVESVRNRDKKDFTALAEKFLSDPAFENKTVDDFARALVTSSEFKPLNVIGAGEELPDEPRGHGIVVVEPLDHMRGTPGYQFVLSQDYKGLRETIKNRGGSASNLPIRAMANVVDTRRAGVFQNVQTSTATSGSGLTSIEKLPGVVALGVRPLTIEDLIAGGSTGNTTIRYIQEVTYTQGITAGVAETGTLPEITVTYQEIDSAVKDIGGFIKMSENLLADYVAVASFINQRLPYQVDRAVDDQLLNGGGTGADLTGILTTSGVQTLALGANTRPDLALKLQTLVRWQNMTSNAAQGGFEPDGYVVHPTDWETLVLTKDSTGQYLCRGPFVGSYGQGVAGPELVEYYTLWGKRVVISPVTAQGTIVCGAWRMGAQKFDRQGLTIEMTNSDGTDFQKRQVTLRGTRRLALAVYRPGSFATGTGL